MNDETELNTDPPLRRCPICNGRMKNDGYWITCGKECNSGSRHDPRMTKLGNRLRLWIGI